MAKKKIVVYDDEEGTGRHYADRLNASTVVSASFRAKALPPEGLTSQLQVLLSRQKAFRGNKDWPEAGCVFDETDVFIIDYDLLKQSPTTTGEHLAYLARCFSQCKLIVGLNQFGQNMFDLTLKGHPESYADVNIGSKQLDNPNLWGGTKPGFAPSCWPSLTALVEQFGTRCSDVQRSVKDSVPLGTLLGIPDNVMRFLPRSVAEFIGRGPGEVTCAQFVLRSGNCLRSKDAKKQERSVPPEMIARIAAARLSKWLERLVLPGQDVLVDGPHLVSRLPSLLRGSAEKIESWQGTARLGCSHRQVCVKWRAVESLRFKQAHWLSRPCWFWRDLCEAEDLGIQEIKEPWTMRVPDWVFCEDASVFVRRDKCEEFVSDTESPYARRFVRRFKGVDYRPSVRFSL